MNKAEITAAISASFWIFLVVTTLLVLAFAIGPLQLSAISLLSIVWGAGLACYLLLAIFVGWRFQLKALGSVLLVMPAIVSTGTPFRYIESDAVLFGYWLFMLLLIVLKTAILSAVCDDAKP